MKSRLWQMRPDALQYLNHRQAQKLAGLDPDTVDDYMTEMFADYMGLDVAPIEYTDDGIAIVSVIGPLYKRKSPWSSNYKAIGEALDELLEMEDDAPLAVVIKIDSPGGMVDGLDDVCSKLAQLADRMVCIASINGNGASAAYRIASQCGQIFATADSEVGSIGTYWQMLDMSAAYAKAGVKSVLLSTGPYKGVGAPGEPITDEQRAFLQDSTNKTNQMFLDDVVAGRGFSESQLAAVSDGRWWIASEAVGLGLVDEIGSLDDVLSAIRSQRKEAVMPKQRLRPATAQANETTPDVVDTVDTVDGSDADETETEVTPVETPAAPQAKGLADYMQAFGDAEGARMFLAGKPWEQAQSDTLQALRGELQDARAEVAQLKSRIGELAKNQLGETEPIQTGTEARKKSFGEACRPKK
jgi:signal peptide peptidase SppA